MIYFVCDADENSVKIGYSKTVAGIHLRIKQLQPGSPVKLKLFGYTTGNWADEQNMHKTFAEHRLTGEWFRFPPIKAIIAPILSAGPPPGENDHRQLTGLYAFAEDKFSERIRSARKRIPSPSYAEIAREVGCSEKTVYNVLKREPV